jgi:predicted dehydrogenase
MFFGGTMSHISLAVFGAGLIGRVHIAKILANPRLKLVVIIDPTDEARDYAMSIKVPFARTPSEAFLKHTFQGAVIATPNHLHVEHGLMCLQHNVIPLVEKPFSHSVFEGEKLVQAGIAKNIPILTGHHRRHNPVIKCAKQAITDGVIGDLVAVTVTTFHYKPEDYWAQGEWRTKKGGGPVLINLIHDLDLMRHLFGEVSEMVALGSNAKRGFEVEDTAAVAMRFANGALGTLIISDIAASTRSWEQTSGEAEQYPHALNEDYIYAAGTLGTLGIPTLRHKSYGGRKHSWYSPMFEENFSVTLQDPLVNQLNNLADVIEGKAAPLVSGAEGLESLRLVEKVKAMVGFA